MSSLGAALLAGSLFLPWYRVSVSSTGLGGRGHAGVLAAAHIGGLSGDLASLHGALAGQPLGAVTAEQVLGALSVILLVLAGLSLLDALVPLVRGTAPVPAGAGGAVVLLGAVASVCVLYRMVAPPSPGGELLALSLREGAWLSLLGALMVALGGLWPQIPAMPGETFGADIWASLTSGTTTAGR